MWEELGEELLEEEAFSHGSSEHKPLLLPSEREIARTKPVRMMEVIPLMCLWYSVSICIIMYNKWMLAKHQFHFPLTMTCCYMLCKLPLSRLTMWILNIPPHTHASWSAYFKKVVCTGVLVSLDISLGNLSFLFISVTFYTIIKSCVPMWQLLFAFLFGFEQPSARLLGVIMLICLGIALASMGEVDFVFWGFVLVFLNAALSGLKGCMLQTMLQGSHGSNTSAPAPAPVRPAWQFTFEKDGIDKGRMPPLHPLVIMYHMSPWTSLTALLAVLVFEADALMESKFVRDPALLQHTVLGLCGACLLVFGNVLLEFKVIAKTSALTLAVSGCVKEVLTILSGVAIFHDHMTPLNGVGLAICMLGVNTYAWVKYQAKQTQPGATFAKHSQ